MTQIQKRSTTLGVVLTTIVWILLVVCCFAIQVAPPHPDYKVIQINLADAVKAAPVVQTQPEQTQPEQTQPVQTQPVQEKQVPQPVQKQSTQTTKKTVPAQTSYSQKQEQPTLQKSVDELMAEQHSSSKKTTEFDDSLFNDSDDFTESTSQTMKPTVTTTKSSSSFSGTAAAGSSADSNKGATTSSTAAKQSNGTASSSTAEALGKIAATSYSQSASDGVKSTVSVSTGTKNGHVAIQLVGGMTRELLSPSRPVIILSKENAERIDSTHTVTITFKVLASGTVPLSSIEIKPASLLPLEIQNEVKSQVSTWRFASASSDGQATFEYSIIKE